jgi:hypothetical protein
MNQTQGESQIVAPVSLSIIISPFRGFNVCRYTSNVGFFMKIQIITVFFLTFAPDNQKKWKKF